MAGAMAERSSLGGAIMLICMVAWAIGAFFLVLAILTAPRDIEALREEMRERAVQVSAGAQVRAAASAD